MAVVDVLGRSNCLLIDSLRQQDRRNSYTVQLQNVRRDTNVLQLS